MTTVVVRVICRLRPVRNALARSGAMSTHTTREISARPRPPQPITLNPGWVNAVITATMSPAAARYNI